MCDLTYAEKILKKSLQMTEIIAPNPWVSIYDYKGPFWTKINDLAYTNTVLCLNENCQQPIWLCRCYTLSRRSGPCECKCSKTPPPPVNVFRWEHHQLTDIQYCACTMPTNEELIELFKLRINYVSQHVCSTQTSWSKVHGDQIAFLLSEMSSLKNEVSILKTALADALEALAQK